MEFQVPLPKLSFVTKTELMSDSIPVRHITFTRQKYSNYLDSHL